MSNFKSYSDPKGEGERVDCDGVNRKPRSRVQSIDDTIENSVGPSRQYGYAPGRHRDTSHLNSEDGGEREEKEEEGKAGEGEEEEEEESDSSSGSKPSNDPLNLNHDIETIGATPGSKRMKLGDAVSSEALTPAGASIPQASPPFMPEDLFDKTLDTMVRFLHAEFAKRNITLPPGVLPPSYPPPVPQNQPAPPANHPMEPPANTLPPANHSPNPTSPFAQPPPNPNID